MIVMRNHSPLLLGMALTTCAIALMALRPGPPPEELDIWIIGYTALTSVLIILSILRYTTRWTILGTGVLLLSIATAVLYGSVVLIHYDAFPFGLRGLDTAENLTRAMLAIANTFLLIGIVRDALARRREARDHGRGIDMDYK